MFGFGKKEETSSFGQPVEKKVRQEEEQEEVTYVIIYWNDGTVETLKNAELSDDGFNAEGQWKVDTEDRSRYIPFHAVKKLEVYVENA